MALYHVATITPSKLEIVAGWIPTQPWGPDAADDVEVVGAYRFDDPAGEVGLETHLVRAGGVVYQVPLTYRPAPDDASSEAFICTTEHSALGTRWVYDGVGDDRYVMMLAAVTLTGQGEALGMVEHEGRWRIAPAAVRIRGGGWTGERVAVDGFATTSPDADVVEFRNDRFAMSLHRCPQPRASETGGSMSLTATWDGSADPVVLATIAELAGG